MTLLSLKATLLKNTSSESPHKVRDRDKMSIKTEHFLEKVANKGESATQRHLHSRVNFPCFNYTEAKSV